MRRTIFTSTRVFPVVMVLTLAAALLPGRALVWTWFPAEIFGIALLPFAHLGNRLGGVVRSPAADGDTRVDNEYVRLLEGEMAEFERLYRVEQARVAELEDQLKQLQGFPTELPRTPGRLIVAYIGLRSPSSPLGAVTLNRGAKHGVTVGTIAVYRQGYLVGRVTEVSGVQCTLLPLGSPAIGGPIGAAVIARDRPTLSAADAPTIYLEPTGDGTFTARPDRALVINEGDQVRLFDPAWPAPAQAMLIGAVESVKPSDMEPLRNIVIVRPAYQISQLTFVTLRLEMEEGEPGGTEQGSGSGGARP